MKTAEDIYNAINSDSVSREMAISLIENHGLRCARSSVEEIHREAGVIHKEIEEVLTRISKNLDEHLDNILQARESLE
jgi:hypothetical protein